MPCYEPPLPHEERLPEFLTAALCHATAHLSEEQLAAFPGLLEWRRRHMAIDAASGSEYQAARDYDQRSGYEPPEFMRQYLEAFPRPLGRGGK